jgi:hypothetical protein
MHWNYFICLKLSGQTTIKNRAIYNHSLNYSKCLNSMIWLKKYKLFRHIRNDHRREQCAV